MRVLVTFAALAACSGPASGPTGTVSLTVHHGPPGTPVIFVDADDSLVASVTSDADGHAEAEMAAGGSVSVYFADDVGNGSGRIYTFADVELGDAYVVNVLDPTWIPVDVTVTVPTYPNANTYVASSPCGENAGASPTLAVELGNCGATTDFYVQALHDSTVLAAFLVKNVTIGPAIALTDQFYIAPMPIAFDVANVPAGLTPLVTANILDGNWRIGSYDCGSVVPCQITAPIVPGADLGMQFEVAAADNHAQAFTGRAPFPGVVPDVAANLMPFIGGGALDGSDVTWTETGDARVAIDGIVVETYRSLPDTPNPIFYGRHTSARHGDATRIHVPHLPADFDAFNVAADTMIGEMYSVGFGADYEAQRLRMYDGVLDHALFEQWPSDHFDHAGL